MSYIIAGRAIKSEYLAISTLLTTGGLTALAMSGGKKQVETPKTNETTVGLAKEQGKIGSSEEEEFIRTFMEAAEKEEKH